MDFHHFKPLTLRITYKQIKISYLHLSIHFIAPLSFSVQLKTVNSFTQQNNKNNTMLL